MQNIYETKAVKKYLSKHINPSFPQTGMNLNTRSLIVGASGSGKTNLLANYHLRAQNTFQSIHIVYKDTEAIYEMLREKIKRGLYFYTSPAELPSLDKIRENHEKEDNILLVIDDWVDQAHRFANLSDIFIRGRKFLTCIFITQSYYKVPKLWRSQLSYIMLLTLSSNKDLKLVLSDYSLGVEKDELVAMYREATSQKFNFFKIDVDCPEPNKKYSRNFTDFFEIE